MTYSCVTCLFLVMNKERDIFVVRALVSHTIKSVKCNDKWIVSLSFNYIFLNIFPVPEWPHVAHHGWNKTSANLDVHSNRVPSFWWSTSHLPGLQTVQPTSSARNCKFWVHGSSQCPWASRPRKGLFRPSTICTTSSSSVHQAKTWECQLAFRFMQPKRL